MAARQWWGIGLALVACGRSAPLPLVYVPPPATVSIPPAEPPPVAMATPDRPSVAESYLRDWSAKSQCDDFDYGRDGGIKTFWCHRVAGLELSDVARLAGVDIYSTPATKDDFGHYNPAFVRWLIEKAAPAAHDSETRKRTQAAFDERLRPLAEIFHYTLQKARAEPECFNRERATYATLIGSKKLPADYYERWFYFMNPAFCDGTGHGSAFTTFNEHGFDAGIDGNVTKSVVGFWLRRSMDGTMDSFAEGLNKLLASYLPELVEHPYRPPPKNIESILDKATTTALTCKGNAKRVGVIVTVQPVGDFEVATVTPNTPASGARFRSKLVRAPDAQALCVQRAFAGQVPAFDGGKMQYQRWVTFP